MPARGTGQISAQLAEGLDIELGARVDDVQELDARAVVVAAPGLLDEPAVEWIGVSCVYFDAPEPPLAGAWLVLGG